MIKAQISKDWQLAFPELKSYSQNKFYKVLGPIIIGIELIKLPGVEHYRPHFVVYSLFGNDTGFDLKSCLSFPIMLQEFYDDKGLQFSIPYDKHSAQFLKIIKLVRKKLPIPTEGNVELNKVVDAFKEFSKKPTIGLSPNSYLQARLYEALLKIVIFSGQINYINSILQIIKLKAWKKEHFVLFNVDINTWLKKVNDATVNRNEILRIVEKNENEKKISKLEFSKILY